MTPPHTHTQYIMLVVISSEFYELKTEEKEKKKTLSSIFSTLRFFVIFVKAFFNGNGFACLVDLDFNCILILLRLLCGIYAG